MTYKEYILEKDEVPMFKRTPGRTSFVLAQNKDGSYRVDHVAEGDMVICPTVRVSPEQEPWNAILLEATAIQELGRDKGVEGVLVTFRHDGKVGMVLI